MKIAILGGTGDFGGGLALRWASSHNIVIGSRDEERAKAFAEKYKRVAERLYGKEMEGSIIGDENFQAAKVSEIVVFSVPYKNLIKFTRSIRPFITRDKIVVSPVVPIDKDGESFSYAPYLLSGSSNSPRYASAAEVISFELKSKRIVAAFHTLPAKKLCRLEVDLDYDVIMAGDDTEAIKQVSKLVSQISNLRPIYAGPLKTSKLLESLTPMLLNVRLYNKMGDLSVKIV
ncbi:MAG: NADPH-dependent F420 reductase [Candidatus Methylarchaceae archaeon HK02M1]|nr:NADPH-dependent F420 reductase [Candidatus Methylarchaceae archaeon HK02M1]